MADVQPVGSGEAALKYLAAYLCRPPLHESQIETWNAQSVTFRYRENGGTPKRGTVSGSEFMRRVLQHVLPKGFRRARNYGFLHPNSKKLIVLLRLLVFKLCGKTPAKSATATPTERPKWLCRCCGGVMHIVRRRILPSALASPGVNTNGEGVAAQ